MFLRKVVLITGASSGIGAETALKFSKLGACVAITDIDKQNLENVASKCEKVSPQKIKPLAIVSDLRIEKDVENIVKTTIQNYKKLDVLVNNAGILGTGSIETTSLNQFDTVMNINIRAPYYLTMLTTPYLIETKGNIVNVSSVGGLRSFPNIIAYATSKAALDQFTRCVALELGPKGVRVNAVNPGVVLTGIHLKAGMNEVDYKAYVEKCKETHALGRPGKTEEVTSVIAFLASDEASNITGATLAVDGGRNIMCPR